MGLKTPLLAALLAALLATLEGTVVAAHRRGRSMPGSPYNISTSDRGLQRAVLSATCCFNNQSNDAFLFKPSTIHRAQRQIVKGIRYVVDFGISRTVCRKRDNNNNNNNLSSCEFQPAGRLQQTFQCHAELWLIPWKNQTRTQVLLCEP